MYFIFIGTEQKLYLKHFLTVCFKQCYNSNIIVYCVKLEASFCNFWNSEDHKKACSMIKVLF